MKTTRSARNLIPAAVALLFAAVVLLNAAPAPAAVDRPGGGLADLRTKLPAADWSVDLTAASEKTADRPGPFLAQADLDYDRPADVYDFEEKSPRRAFLQSFLLPGWGQYYVRSAWWKPVVFLGVELASWYGVSHFHSSGQDRETEYKGYADDHWYSEQYLRGLWYVYYSGSTADSTDLYLDTLQYTYIDPITDTAEDRIWSHHAFFHADGSPVAKDEYYENIGKYDQFAFGWDDFAEPGDTAFPRDKYDEGRLSRVTEHRKTYLQMRADANTEYKRASTMLAVVIANHLVSGIEAALGARRYNRSRDEFGTVETQFRWVMSPTTGRPMPQLTLGYRF